MRLNWNKIMMETYRELYKNSDPTADFDELVKNAEINDRGQKVIKFLDYEIDDLEMNYIIESIIKKYKIPKRLHSGYKGAILLGCSPKSKNYDQISG